MIISGEICADFVKISVSFNKAFSGCLQKTSLLIELFLKSGAFFIRISSRPDPGNGILQLFQDNGRQFFPICPEVRQPACCNILSCPRSLQLRRTRLFIPCPGIRKDRSSCLPDPVFTHFQLPVGKGRIRIGFIRIDTAHGIPLHTGKIRRIPQKEERPLPVFQFQDSPVQHGVHDGVDDLHLRDRRSQILLQLREIAESRPGDIGFTRHPAPTLPEKTQEKRPAPIDIGKTDIDNSFVFLRILLRNAPPQINIDQAQLPLLTPL